MTRKDYIAIAAAIRATQERIKSQRFSSEGQENGKVYPVDQDEQLRGVRRAAAHIADALQADNPRGFDPVMFLKNCGYGATSDDGRRAMLGLSKQAWADREEKHGAGSDIIVDKQVWPDRDDDARRAAEGPGAYHDDDASYGIRAGQVWPSATWKKD